MPDVTDRNFNNDVNIKKLEIRKPTGETLQIFPLPEEKGSPKSIFRNLAIKEGMFQPSLSGTLVLEEPSAIGEEFNFRGNEILHLEIETPGTEDSEHDIDFYIHDYRLVGDEVTATEHHAAPGKNIHTKWMFEFTSAEYYYLDNQNLVYSENDYFGKIAKGASLTGQIGEIISFGTRQAEQGLVDDIAEKYFNPSANRFSTAQENMDIENTSNSIWLQSEQNMYPWAKTRSTPSLIQLMHNLAENSVSSENPYAVNYLFWQDLKQWRFRSIDSLIRDQEEPVIEYKVSFQDEDNRLYSFQTLSEANHLQLLKRGAYKSFYELIKPSFSDPYFEYIDFSSTHTKETIFYDYHADHDKWAKVEQYQLVPDSFNEDFDFGSSSRKYDDFYGYFSAPYNNPDPKDHDPLGELSTIKEEKMWQTMFDQTDLDIGVKRTIEKEIKGSLQNKYAEYILKKNIKDKWDVYECSICCLSGGGSTAETSEVNVVSSGTFTDVVNYDPENSEFESGLQLSYDLEDGSVWAQTIGEFYYLRGEVDNYLKWTFDLQINHIQHIRQWLNIAKTSLEGLNCESETEYAPGHYNNRKPCFYMQLPTSWDGDCYAASLDCNNDGICLPCYFGSVSDFEEELSCDFARLQKENAITNLSTTIDYYDSYLIGKLESDKGNWQEYYEDFIGKKVFPFSKEPTIPEDITPTTLFNIKSIKRLSIRGSKYEVFSRRYNILEQQFDEEWPYLAYIDNDLSRDPIQEGNHPIYGGKYCNNCGDNAFFPSRKLYVHNASNTTWSWYSQFASNGWSAETECGSPPENFVPLTWPIGVFNPWSGVEELEWDPESYVYHEDVYAIDVENDKPVPIKLLELDSYVRVEFENPIGEETLENFPYGIDGKDAGIEYYAPYIIIINKMPFPNSKEAHLFIMGQDPYGFDVGIKMNKSSDGDISLYPKCEGEFQCNETERPYYVHDIMDSIGGWGSWFYQLDRLRDFDEGSITKWTKAINWNAGGWYNFSHYQDYSSLFSRYYWNWGYNYWYRWRSSLRFMGLNDPEMYEAGLNSTRTLGDYFAYAGLSLVGSDNVISLEGYNTYSEFYYGWFQFLSEKQFKDYHSSLAEEDIWKYDISGKSQYGIIQPNKDITSTEESSEWFDNIRIDKNFAAQFMILSTTTTKGISRCSDFSCANPDGTITSQGCPEEFPWCNCPCQDLIPRDETIISADDLSESGLEALGSSLLGGLLGLVINGISQLLEADGINYVVINSSGEPLESFTTKEDAEDWLVENGTIAEKPTPTELAELKDYIRECDLIESELGEEWLGCVWKDPTNISSCNCPCVGKRFKDYMEYTRTYSTYWNTPKYAPLYRMAQMNLIQAQRANAIVSGDFRLRPGNIINIVNENVGEEKHSQKRSSGRWMIEEINHLVDSPQNHLMGLSLIRDSGTIDPNETEEPSLFAKIFG